MEKIIRTRIAPSPTGDPHVGTLRTALYNYYYAHKTEGKFVLRIEDTDKNREVAGSIEKIYESLEWIGVKPDEGMKYGGEYGPYLQSDRLNLYQKYARQLVDSNHAYYCFCSAERLTKLREDEEKNHRPPRYDGLCSNIDQNEALERTKNEPFVIRLKVPSGEVIGFDDAIKGKVEINSNEIDDQVLIKSDGFPTYHLAVVVDDHLMKITHVIRGEEWISSTPKHILLYRYFEWDLPVFAHLPLILNTDRSKLAKRHNNTSVLYYKVEQGYHPAAMRHFLMFMGWTPKSVKEFYNFEDFLNEFSIDRVGVSPAVFDLAKLESLSHDYISKERIEDLIIQYSDWLKDDRHNITAEEKLFLNACEDEKDFATAALEVARMRGSTYRGISDAIAGFFEESQKCHYDDLSLDGKIQRDDIVLAIQTVKAAISSINIKSLPKSSAERVDYLTKYFRELQPKNLSGQSYLHPTRVALTKKRVSMNMFEFLSAYLLKRDGLEEVIGWLEDAAQLDRTSK